MHLNGDAVPLGEVKCASNSEVHFVDPGTVKGIQIQRRTRPVSASNARSGIDRRLINAAVIKGVAATAGADIYPSTSSIEQAGVRPARVELHERADRPIGEQAAHSLTSEVRRARRINCSDSRDDAAGRAGSDCACP